MSIVKDLKHAQFKVEQLAADLAKMTAERDAEVAARAADAKAHAEAVAAITKQTNESAEAAKIEQAKAAELSAQVAKLVAEANAAEEQAVKLRAALANPACIDAGATGVLPLEDKPGTDVDVVAQFESITDPQAKRAYYLANEKAIKQAQKGKG